MPVLPAPEDIIASRQLGAVPIASGGVVFRLWQRAGMDVYVTGTFSAWTTLQLHPEEQSGGCRGTGASWGAPQRRAWRWREYRCAM